MNTLKSLKNLLVWLLIMLLAVPPPVFAQDGTAAVEKFSQEELDQMLAPVALYPDSLLGQIFIASTYPLEVILADRWVKQNNNLKGDALNDALDKQNWDASVKALVPFPEVLSMMSEKTEWTQNLGDAFLSQQDDVMDTVQRLRERARNAGNLKTTEQQVVVIEKEIIRVEPANPQVVYVPVYDPWWVYGPWWWPAYPPYVIYPYRPGVVITPGFIWFGFGFAVGSFWVNSCNWDWHHHHVVTTVNRNININRTYVNVNNVRMGEWRHSPVHRRGVVYRDQYTRERYRQIDRNAVNSRRDFRGYEGGRVPGREGAPARPGVQTARPGTVSGKVTQPGAVSGPTQRPGTQVTRPGTETVKPGTEITRPATPTVKAKPEATVSRPATERAPRGPSGSPTLERGKPPQALQGMGKGSEVRRQSSWGQNSRNASKAQIAPKAAPSVQPRGTTGGAPKVQTAPRGGASAQPQGGDMRTGAGGASAQPQGGGGARGAAPGGRR